MQRSRVIRAVASMFVARARAPMVQRMLAPTVAMTASLSTPLRFYGDAGHGDSATRTGQYLLNKEDVLTRVLEVVKNFEKVDAAKVTAESHFINDLGLDSLDVVEVVMALEQEFILDIPDHDAEKIQSIKDAVEYIAQNPMAK